MSAARGALPLALALTVLALAACTPAPPPAAPPTPAPASSSAPPTSTAVHFGSPPGHRFGTEVTLSSGVKLTVAAPRPLPVAELPKHERRPGTRAVLVTVTMVNNGRSAVDYPDPGFTGSFVAHGSDEVVRVDSGSTEATLKQFIHGKPIPPGGSAQAEFWLRLPERPGALQLAGSANLVRDEFDYEGEV